MRRIFATIAAATGLASSAFAATVDLSTVTTDKVFYNGDVITGTLGANVKLEIADNAYVTLRNAKIDGSNNSLYPWAGLTCLGNAEIRIDGINYVRGFHSHYPGIHVPAGNTLTIRQAVNIPGYAALGGGTLEARDNGTAAGIGAGASSSCGNIVIESGIITAQGHNAAGIGGGGESCGDITIKGGVVYATGGNDGAGIGGCGSSAGCGNITIEEGVTLVVAQAGQKNDPAPIGAGGGGTCGAVTVNLAEGATDTTGVTGSGFPTRTIERPSIVQQYANGLTWDFRIVNGEAEICDMYYDSNGTAQYKQAIATDYAGALVIPSTLGGCPVTTIGNSAISACHKITSVTIPDSVKTIKGWAFQSCSKLESATIPASVTSIGTSAFRSCVKLASVTIPEGVTELGAGAFENCNSLTSVTIPGSVKLIGELAFEGCDGLTSVTIMDGVETIGAEAFRDSFALTSVTIPASVKTIEANAFAGCTSLEAVNGLTDDMVVGEGVFLDCPKLADANWFVIINNVLYQYIGGDANVTVPAGVTRIDGSAFAMHNSLPAPFGRYPKLVSVTIPASVTSIGLGAFAYCTDLEHVSFPANMPSIEDGAFYLCVKLADANGFVIIGGVLHTYIGTATEVTIPSGVTSIGRMSFMSYTGIPPQYFGMSPVTSVTIPSGVTTISTRAFYNCPLLTSVSIPSTVTDIGMMAFYNMMSNDNPLQTVHVEAGDTERVKGILSMGNSVDGITFVEDYKPMHPITCYAMLNEGDITAPYAAVKAVTLKGAAYDGCDVAGVIELKLGKVNAKKKISKVSGAFTGLDGKKRAMKAVTVAGIDGTSPATVTLNVKGLGPMTVAIGGSQFAGTLGAWHVQSAAVGGKWNKATATAAVDTGDVSMFHGQVLQGYLPNRETAGVKNGKWSFKKAAGVKWAKPKKGAPNPDIYDVTSGKGLIVDVSKDKTNLSGIKLAYTPKTGLFKGSFKVFELQGTGKATKLKKYTVKVTGVVVDEVGYGIATGKKPSVNWAVTVE